jgi:hypothetical protein
MIREEHVGSIDLGWWGGGGWGGEGIKYKKRDRTICDH